MSHHLFLISMSGWRAIFFPPKVGGARLKWSQKSEWRESNTNMDPELLDKRIFIIARHPDDADLLPIGNQLEI